MARKRKDTFFHDMATAGMTRALIKMSQAGLTPSVGPGQFPGFQVYPSNQEGFDLTCDLACMLGSTMQEKQDMAAQLIKELEQTWAVSPFSDFTQTGPGFIHFNIPEGATKR